MKSSRCFSLSLVVEDGDYVDNSFTGMIQYVRRSDINYAYAWQYNKTDKGAVCSYFVQMDRKRSRATIKNLYGEKVQFLKLIPSRYFKGRVLEAKQSGMTSMEYGVMSFQGRRSDLVTSGNRVVLNGRQYKLWDRLMIWKIKKYINEREWKQDVDGTYVFHKMKYHNRVDDSRLSSLFVEKE